MRQKARKLDEREAGKIQEFLSFAQDMADAYVHGWRVVCDYGPREVNMYSRRLGQCRYREKEIGVSWFWILRGAEKEVLNTLLHEIAHAMDTTKSGHGLAWEKCCHIVGCPANATHKNN